MLGAGHCLKCMACPMNEHAIDCERRAEIDAAKVGAGICHFCRQADVDLGIYYDDKDDQTVEAHNRCAESHGFTRVPE